MSLPSYYKNFKNYLIRCFKPTLPAVPTLNFKNLFLTHDPFEPT